MQAAGQVWCAGQRFDWSARPRRRPGAQGLTPVEIETAVRRYAKWEKDIDRVVHPGRRESRNTYCRSMTRVVQNLDAIPTEAETLGAELRKLEELRRKRDVGLYDKDLAAWRNRNYWCWNPNAAERATIRAGVTAGRIATEKARLDREIKALKTKIAAADNDKPKLDRDDLIDAAEGRYQKLNLEALDDHGTLEFRQHNGSIDPKVVTSWIRFVVNFVERSRTVATGNKRIRDIGLFTGLPPSTRLFYQKRARMRSRDIQAWASA